MYSLGIEQEFYILDARNHEPVFLTPLESKQLFGNAIKQETYPCQIEINTPICRDIQELEKQHQILLTNLYQCAQQHHLLILNSASLPHINHSNYYQLLLKTMNKGRKTIHESIQKLIENFMCCSIQFHVQTTRLDLRYPLISQLRPYLPIFLALSTNSPFWKKQMTGLKSYRSQMLQSLPNAGLPPDFESMNDFNHFTNYLKQSGMIESTRELWWDLRPHRIYPTIECRICDNVHNPRDAIAICALFQSLVYQLEQDLIKGVVMPKSNWFFDQENRWSAARYGLEGQYIDFQRDEIIHFKQAVFKLLEYVEGGMKFFNTQCQFKEIMRILECGTSADKQVAIYNEYQSFKPVIEYLTTFQ